jgi:hypothetical protein
MGAVEIDRGDSGRIGQKVGEHVATPGGDRDHLMSRADVERLHIDNWILPDLRIDQALERKREEALEYTRARERLRTMDRGLESCDGRAMRKVT